VTLVDVVRHEGWPQVRIVGQNHELREIAKVARRRRRGG